MNTKKFVLLLCLTITIILFLFKIYWIKTDRAKEKISLFFNAVLSKDDMSYEEHIHPHYEGNLELINFLYENRDYITYDIMSTKIINTREYKVLVTLQYKNNNIPLTFIVEKFNKKLCISHIPNYKFIPAALFLEKDNHNITVDIQGKKVSYICKYPFSTEKWTPISLHIIDNYIFYHEILEMHNVSKVLQRNYEVIEDIYVGNIQVVKNIPIYMSGNDEVIYSNYDNIPIGTENIYIYSDDNNIGQLAILDRQKLPKNKIRVLLNDSSYKNKYHEQISLILGTSCIIKEYSGVVPQKFHFEEGDELLFKTGSNGIDLYYKGNILSTTSRRWHIEGNDDNIFYIKDIKREFSKHLDKGTCYKGNLEIAIGVEGLILINELDIEKYLYSVVTSEMPVAFGLEALKVQAIVARAYAVAAINRSGFAIYGAHLDDSTASQMYNNIEESPIAIEAVNSTCGLVPFFEDEIADTRFFSTSCGYTAEYSEVWSDSEGKFPGIQKPYLRAKPQYIGDSPSLHNEENFRAFIDNINNTSFDRFSPMFRWSVKFSREQLENSIAYNLPIVQEEDPNFILTFVGDNKYEYETIPDDIGKLLNITVTKRGQGGNIMELEISTTSGIYKVKKELNIRNVIKPIDYIDKNPVELKCHDGTIRENFPLLPSAFAYIDIERDTDGNITYITVVGGGYGHGVGMSQYGTYGLCLLGKNYIEILEHYYPECELKKYNLN
ncbi:MAG TPA: SpoIID/LytB domain-containing protein [Clostridiales bacterium]|nr:SpoIID/LytB domain-containing protein [Clostridiales bacterium]